MHDFLYVGIFLAFDVDVLYLFPGALAYNLGFVVCDSVSIVIFLGILSLASSTPGPRDCSCGRKKVAPGSVVRLAVVEEVLNQFRANSLWPIAFGLACCAIEMMAAILKHFRSEF